MDYNNMRKAQLIDELIKLRQKNKELEEAPKDYGHMSMLSKSFFNKRWFSDGGPAAKIFYSAPDMMAIVNLKGGYFVEINEAFIANFAYERYEVIGRNAEELALFLSPREKDALISRIRAGKNIRDFEISVKSKYGEIRILLIATEKIELDAEEYIIVMARDITMRKQVEERLCLSEECLSKAFDTSPIVMTITTLEEGRFIRANQAFQRIVGYDHREVIGRTSLEIGFWLNRQAREPLIQKIRAGKPLRDLEITFGTKRGEERMGLLSAEGINVNGILCVICVLTDITEFKRMEAGIARLDALNMVGEMAASIAHEIRNPMTTVRGYLQLMRENKDNLEEQKYYDLMIEELDRANAILTDFLSLAKCEFSH